MRAHLRADLIDEGRSLSTRTLTLLTGPGGSGKTTLARAWRRQLADEGRTTVWLPLSELHGDPVVLVEDLVTAMREAISDPLDEDVAFGTRTLRSLPSIGAGGAQEFAAPLLRELRRLSGSVFVFLDAVEHLDDGSISGDILDALLRNAPPSFHWILTSRGRRPEVWARLDAEQRAREIGAEALHLRMSQVEAVLADAGVDLTESERTRLLARTEGWPIGVDLAARALSDVVPSERTRFIDELSEQRDVFRYIATELVARADPAVLEMVENAALLGRTERRVLLATIADARADADRILERALALGLLTAQGRHVSVHDLLADWLRRRLRERSTPEAWRRRHAELGRIAEEQGLGIETLSLYTTAGLPQAIAEILERRGSAWVQLGHAEHLDRALQLVPEADRRERPGLVALEGLIASGRDPERAIECLKIAIEMYRRAGHLEAEFVAFHELGIVAMNENRMHEVRGIYRHALGLRRVALQPRLRGIILMALGAGSFVTGRYGAALRLLATADTYDLPVQERGGIGLITASIHFHRGDWDRLVGEIEARCEDPVQRMHGTSYHVMEGFRSLVLGLRGLDPEGALDRLEEASEFFALAPRSLSRIRIEVARGHVARSAGRPALAITCFETAATLAAKIRLHEAEAAALGLLARTHQAEGDAWRAREHAAQAVALLERPEAWSARGGSAAFWAAGIAQALVVLAECGETERAAALFARHHRRLLHRELPLCAHAIHWMNARVAALAGDEKTAARALAAARRLEREADLRDRAPEIDPVLAAWARSSQRPADGDAPAPAAEPSRPVALRSFGGLALELAGRPIPERAWRGTITRRLLARILVAEGEAVPRERIEAELWPDAGAASARNSLRVTLSRLRDVLEPRRRKGASSPYLRIDGDRVAVTEALLRDWDVTHWRQAIAALEAATAAGDAEATDAALEEARRLASDGFLPGLYDDAVVAFARHLDERWLSLLGRASAAWLEADRPELAARLAEAGLARDPLDETLAARLVEARLASGDRGAARRALARIRERLASELDCEPGEVLVGLERKLAVGAD